MKIQDIKLGVYEKAIPLQFSWPEKFNTAREAGFNFIELSIDGVEPRISRLKWTRDELMAIRRAAEEADMPFYTMALTANRYFPLGDDRETVREQGKAIVRRAIEIASFLGIKIIQLAPYDVNGRASTRQTRENFKTSLAELIDFAALYGVILSVEVMPDVPFINSVKAARELTAAFDSPYLQIYTDTGNVASTGADPVPDLKNGGRHLVACHVKDGTLGCYRNVPYGEGLVDFGRCFREFVNMGYRGFFVMEMWSEEDEGFVPYLKTAVNYIRGIMKQVDEMAV